MPYPNTALISVRPILPALLSVTCLLQGCGSTNLDGADEERTAPLPAMDLLTKLLGWWQHEDPGTGFRFEEHWSTLDDGGLQGHGVVLSGRDTVMIEHLRILRTDSGTWYSARIPSQNAGEAVYFELVHERDSLVFIQPQHDFPQRITYIPGLDEGWHVRLQGERQGEPREEHLHFTPVRDQGVSAQ